MRATTRRLRKILDGAIATSIISTDLNGTITSFSAGAELIFGLDSDQVVGRRNISTLFEPSDLEDMGADIGVRPGFAVFVALSAGVETGTVLRIKSNGGGPVFTRQLVTEMHNPAGQRTGFLSVGYDVSREVRDHEALNASAQRWRTLLEHLPDTMVAVIDDGGAPESGPNSIYATAPTVPSFTWPRCDSTTRKGSLWAARCRSRTSSSTAKRPREHVASRARCPQPCWLGASLRYRDLANVKNRRAHARRRRRSR